MRKPRWIELRPSPNISETPFQGLFVPRMNRENILLSGRSPRKGSPSIFFKSFRQRINRETLFETVLRRNNLIKYFGVSSAQNKAQNIRLQFIPPKICTNPLGIVLFVERMKRSFCFQLDWKKSPR